MSSRFIAWHWFGFELPPLWEVTGYSVGKEKGSLQFYTREGFVAELSWRRTKAVPDQRRIMSEVHRRHLAAASGDKKTPVPTLQYQLIGEFVVAYRNDGELFQASIFQKEENILLEWLFPSYAADTFINLVTPLLQSYTPNDGDTKRWALFGGDISLPRELNIAKMEPLPGHVVFEFITKKRMHFNLRRWALPEELLGPMDLSSFARHLARKFFRKVLEIKQERFNGHDAVRLLFSQKGQIGFERIVGQWWQGEMLIWWDREQQRLSCLEQFGPKRQKRVEFNDVWQR